MIELHFHSFGLAVFPNIPAWRRSGGVVRGTRKIWTNLLVGSKCHAQALEFLCHRSLHIRSDSQLLLGDLALVSLVSEFLQDGLRVSEDVCDFLCQDIDLSLLDNLVSLEIHHESLCMQRSQFSHCEPESEPSVKASSKTAEDSLLD
jgi:hypothetical protein